MSTDKAAWLVPLREPPASGQTPAVHRGSTATAGSGGRWARRSGCSVLVLRGCDRVQAGVSPGKGMEGRLGFVHRLRAACGPW